MTMIRRLVSSPILLTVPAFGVMFAVFGIPMILLFLTSLNAPEFSLANYVGFFEKKSYVLILIQTLKISLVATAICLLIGYPIAYLIANAGRARPVLVVMVFLPWLTSALVRTYAWTVVLGDNGLINSLLLNLGFIDRPLTLIYNRFAVYVGMVHIMLPMMILPLLSVMVNIDKSLMEAARSMGAKPFTAFLRVFLPLSVPGIRSGCILVFVVCLGFYITPQALGGLGDTMLSTLINSQLTTSLDIAPTAAAAFILLAMALLVLSTAGVNLASAHGQAGSVEQKIKSNRRLSFSKVRRYLGEVATPIRARSWGAKLYKSRRDTKWAKVIGASFLALVLFFLLAPGLIVIVISFSPGEFLEFPPKTWSLRWYYSFFQDPTWTGALWNSFKFGLIVSVASAIAGTTAAFGLSRCSPSFRSSMTMVILTPITFPIIVVGVAVYLGLARIGLVGTSTGIILGHIIGAIGYVVVIVLATLSGFDRRLEQAAMSMRAGPTRTFMRVTFPLIRSGIIGGALFAFLASFDEVIITSFVSGYAIPTLPLKMLENLKQQVDPTIAAVGSLLTLLPIVWLVALYFTLWRGRSSLQNATANPA
ncbi:MULTISPECIES: ABC transporter permease subunit [Rhizobium]|uniref:Spermidine/putrescine transport system permease protein n=1 Tax=Rhizobium binae TaxID=1138190 RepID=A0ABV2MPJ0_9HYPH|nr:MULTISPECIES: ABC transporter permease subunit [Rhizobium]NKL49685.1 ABC transporter permease subunit [Rhizobium leguminosarum bv. viciae]MBX4936973.1 ABC transporter permease subunit [Rhizobium binae]MBX4943623.1 ABC transporter permease subunit [Rhizobium binae]MBX4979067.1 ABC transporter permease subunit [Rhizobium binae]MBX4995804.1 ABC transporter permease subunit [Rhizobium binae]